MTPLPPDANFELEEFARALDGQYELVREIGRGGMGIVYLARDVKLDRAVAIKTLPPHLMGDAAVRERFLREARTAGALSHPNIVPVHRADELDGRVFFVMGYVDGASLARDIQQRGPLDPRDVLRHLRDVADALGYAHARGVVHRDVKAENILLDAATGRAMVTDFGIARLAESAPLTATGQMLGTVYYLSPEQITGDTVDGRSDIYALGVVGYYALAGRFPFDAALASAVLVAHVTKTAPPLREVAPEAPPVLTDIVDRCLSKDPADRFQDCAELRTALANIEHLVAAEVKERTASGTARPEQMLVSNTEARDILARAADLQAATGTHPRPAPAAGPRERPRHVSDTSGHKLANVRDAAIEAGIGSAYVDRALEERGLAPGGEAHALSPSPSPPSSSHVPLDRSSGRTELTGAPTRLEFEIVLDGEMPTDDFDLLVDIARSSAGDPGQVTSIGRSLSWQTNPRKGALQVTVLPRGGRTVMRVSESESLRAARLVAAPPLVIGGLLAPIAMGLALYHAGPLLPGATWLGAVAISWIAGRGAFATSIRKRQQHLRDLTDRLAAEARASIAAARPRLAGGAPTPPTTDR